MPDASSKNLSLENLPEKKADLEETRQLLDRLEGRKGETDPDRYERLRQRYEGKIDKLEPTVERLTDEGKTRKLELEDRLACQQSRVEEAETELDEIEQLHEEGAMGEEAYREDRRRKTAREGIGRARRAGEGAWGRLAEWGRAAHRSRLVWGSVVGVLVLAAACGELGGSSGTEAAMFGGGPARAGVHEGPGPEAPVEAKWRFETDGRVYSSPAVVGGTVYVGSGDRGSEDRHVYAIDTESGEEQWRFQTDGTVFSSPAVAGGTVYVGSHVGSRGTVSGGGHVYAIDAESGEEQWRFQTDRRVSSSPAVVEGTVYVGGGDGHVYALE